MIVTIQSHNHNIAFIFDALRRDPDVRSPGVDLSNFSPRPRSTLGLVASTDQPREDRGAVMYTGRLGHRVFRKEGADEQKMDEFWGSRV